VSPFLLPEKTHRPTHVQQNARFHPLFQPWRNSLNYSPRKKPPKTVVSGSSAPRFLTPPPNISSRKQTIRTTVSASRANKFYTPPYSLSLITIANITSRLRGFESLLHNHLIQPRDSNPAPPQRYFREQLAFNQFVYQCRSAQTPVQTDSIIYLRY